MATFPCKSNKRKKKKNQYLALAHKTKTLVICKKYTYYKIKFAHYSLNNMLQKVYKNFQKGINLQISGAL